MDVCSLDWGAIGSFTGAAATLYAAKMAWKISQEWQEQKRTEVLAIEAQELRVKIKKLINGFKLHPELKVFTYDNTLEIKDLLDDIRESFEFITEENIDQNRLYSLSNCIEDFYYNPPKDPTTITNYDVWMYKNIQSEIDSFVKLLVSLRKDLKPIALYRSKSPTRMQG